MSSVTTKRSHAACKRGLVSYKQRGGLPNLHQRRMLSSSTLRLSFTSPEASSRPSRDWSGAPLLPILRKTKVLPSAISVPVLLWLNSRISLPGQMAQVCTCILIALWTSRHALQCTL
eukprot:825457-Amphidinium_carterae.1